jgi:hypothetical protein
VLGLLGGSLLCLLLINTVLATGAFQITALEHSNTLLSQREQELRAALAAEQSPSALARRARELGMAEPALLHFLNLTTGRADSQPSRLPGIPLAPGYTP